MKDAVLSEINKPGLRKTNTSPIIEATKTTRVSPWNVLPIPVAMNRIKSLNKRRGKTIVLISKSCSKRVTPTT